MARIRTIKPDAFKSDTLSACSPLARWTFAGLWTYCDDYGRARNDVRLIKAELYPLDDTTTLQNVATCLAELVAADGAVCVYEVAGKPYLHIPRWKDHQRVSHPTDSKIPACPSHSEGVIPEPSGEIPEDLQSPPEPVRPEQGTGSREQGRGTGNAPAKRAASLPESWAPNEQHTKKAQELELDLAAEVEHFRDHAAANGVTKKDWNAAFRMWLRNSAKWGNSKRNPNRSTGPDWDAAMNRAGSHLEVV